MKRDAADPAMSGFYIPPQMLTQEEFKKAASCSSPRTGTPSGIWCRPR